MSISRTVSGVNGDFGLKSQVFPTPRVFNGVNAPAESVSLQPGSDGRSQKQLRMVGYQYQKVKKLRRHNTGVTDRQTHDDKDHQYAERRAAKS